MVTNVPAPPALLFPPEQGDKADVPQVSDYLISKQP